MRNRFLVLAIAWGALFFASSQPNSFAQQADFPPRFQFVEAGPETKLHEAEVSSGLPDDLLLADLLAELEFEEADLIWKGRLSYGDARAVSMAVCIFQATEQLQFYVDRNRDRVLQKDEVLASVGASQWGATLVAVQADWEESDGENSKLTDSTDSPARSEPSYPVRIRFESATATVFIATAGAMNGQVKYQDRECAARYEDRNANGLWFDSEDRLFVDLNGDGKINTISERLPCQGMRMIGGTLFAIAGDPRGRSLSIEPVLEKGMVIPRIRTLVEGAEIISLSGSIGSTSGFGIPIKALDEPIEVPIGNWQVKDLILEVKEGDQHFQFVFNHLGGNQPVEVTSGVEVELELLGELKLSASVNRISSANQGGRILVTPTLKSSSGCYLRNSKVGKQAASNENRLISMSRFNNDVLVLGSSGFS